MPDDEPSTLEQTAVLEFQNPPTTLTFYTPPSEDNPTNTEIHIHQPDKPIMTYFPGTGTLVNYSYSKGDPKPS